MRKKVFILTAVCLLLITGCGSNVTRRKNANIKIELTEKEVASTAGNSNIGAELLVRKALLKEVATNIYTPEEEKEINNAIENLEIEYFLNKVASKNVVITDEEVLALYKENSKNLKGIDAKVALPQVRQSLFFYKVKNEKINYINSLIEKYGLNEKLKLYYQ